MLTDARAYTQTNSGSSPLSTDTHVFTLVYLFCVFVAVIYRYILDASDGRGGHRSGLELLEADHALQRNSSVSWCITFIV